MYSIYISIQGLRATCATCATKKGKKMDYSYQTIMDEIKKCSCAILEREPSSEKSLNVPTVSTLKIEKMTECLHGKSCHHLKSDPPARPICEKAGEPVWDLTECPIQNWAPKQQKLSQIKITNDTNMS